MLRLAVWFTMCGVLAFPNASRATTFALSGSCEDQGIQLRLNIEDHGHKPEVVAFHVYRRPIAVGCSDAERVTSRPIPRQGHTQYVVTVLDAAVRVGVAYEYTLVGVDEQLNEHMFPYAVPTWVGCGDAPVAHGFIEKAGWVLVVDPACAVHCNPPAPIVEWPLDIDAWVGRRMPVLLYGSVGWNEASGPTMSVSDWRLESCTVAVETTTWGLVKRLFR